MHARCSTPLLFTVAFLCLSVAGAAQNSSFGGRLSPLPADAFEARTMQGEGSVNASLQGMTLTIKASFEGLNSPATGAAIRRAIPGLRGPVQFPLSVTKSTKGSIDAKLTLTAAQVDHLKRGWYYLQIDTEKNPDGHIRGWLLPKERT